MIKKVFIFVMIVMMVLTTAPVGAENSEFSDIRGHWGEKFIVKWAEKGVISRYPDGTFRPDDTVTRAEVAKIFALAFDLKRKPYTIVGFSDLDSSAWYYPYLECAARYIPKYPLVNDVPIMYPYQQGGSKFLPNLEAIRMHVAEALVEIKMEKDNLDFEVPDIYEIQKDLTKDTQEGAYMSIPMPPHGGIPWNVRRMFEYTWLAKELDVMEGDENGHFLPYNYISRAGIVTMIERLFPE